MRTQREINKAIDSFEQEVKAQLALGLKPNEAVKNAYAKYPVMDMMKATLQAELVNTFVAGYGGIVPYSGKSISQAMSESWASDDLTLSKRLYRRSSTIRNEVADTIKQALKTNKTVKGLAKSIFDGYGKGGIIPEASIPKFLHKLSDINISGEATPEAKRKQRELLRSVKGKIARLDTPYVRAAYNEVAAAVEDGNEIRLQKAIYTATQEKARYHAERIARTENARAYADGQMSRYLDDEDVVAFQWKLSANHPRYDICDFYANADLYGLGKGVYPKDKFPTLPAHPHCMCHIRPMTELDIDVNKRHNNLEQSGLEYINSLSKKHQEVLLGVNGRNTVLSGKGNWQNFVRGWTPDTFKVRIPQKEYGALSGAINDISLDVNERRRAKKHANLFYETIRNSNRRILVDKISKSSKMHSKSIEKVIEHVFDNMYNLNKGSATFEPDFQMAQSFQRLISGKPLKRDIIMLKHERLEYELMHRYGYTDYATAHRITERKYNYAEAVRKEVYHVIASTKKTK